MGFLQGIAVNTRLQNIVICWVSPLLIGSIIFVIVVLPDIRQAAAVASVEAAVSALHVNKFLFVFIVSLAVGVFLYVNRLPLWHLLEGYSWPHALRRWRIHRAHVPQCRWLQARLFCERAQVYAELAQRQLDETASPTEREQLEQKVTQAQNVTDQWREHLRNADLAREKRDRPGKYPSGFGWLPRRHQPLFTLGLPAETAPGQWTLPYPAPSDRLLPYPNDSKYSTELAHTHIMPTLLGNAMRVMETYGVNKYGLDSQIMWFELLAVAPESLQATLEEAQLEADTIVCATYTAAVLAGAATAAAAWRAVMGVVDTKLWVVAGVSILMAFILYRRLLNRVDAWASSIRTLVNGARGPLREKYNLRLPASAEEEKRMWEALTATIWYGSDQQHERELDKYKQPARRPRGSDDFLRRRGRVRIN